MIIVNMTEFFPWAFILHLARALIVFNIVHAMLKDKYNTAVTFLSIVGGYMAISGIGVTVLNEQTAKYELIFYVLTILCYLSAICLVCRGKLLYKLFVGFLAEGAKMAGSFAYAVFSQLFAGQNAMRLAEFEMYLYDLIADSIFIFAFSYLFVFVIRLIQRKTSPATAHNRRALWMYLFPVTHILCTPIAYVPVQLLVSFDLDSAQVSRQLSILQTMIFVALGLCFLLDIAVLFAVDYMNKMEERDRENQKQILKANMNYEQMQMVREEHLALRKIRHDMSNLLTTAAGFIEIGKPEKAEDILKSAGSTVFEGGGTTLCSNETINTTVYIKQQYAKEHGVSLQVSVEENAPVKISDYDLCRLLHNLLDNALHAAAESEEKSVCFSLCIDPDRVCVEGENSVPDTPVKQRDGHGYGTTIIREIVKKYGGAYTVTQTKPTYKTVVLTPNTAQE